MRNPTRSCPKVLAIHLMFSVNASACFFRGPGKGGFSSFVLSFDAVVTNRQGRAAAGPPPGASAAGPAPWATGSTGISEFPVFKLTPHVGRCRSEPVRARSSARVVARGVFSETGLAKAHSPTVKEMIGLERRSF